MRPLRIRAHTLLCLQGFRGEGYSPEFARKMTALLKYLQMNPEADVEIITQVDVFCESCPHNNNDRCIIDEPDGLNVPSHLPDNMSVTDKRVLAWLGIREGQVLKWKDAVQKVGETVNSSCMDILCGNCRWREFPYCSEALNMLHAKVHSEQGHD